MHGLEVISPGMLSLIQDPGRFGVGHLGLSVGGPVDMHAFCWANRLLGNKMTAPALEITLGQASFKATQDITLSLTGADMQAEIDGQVQENWRSFTLKKGQTLALNFAREGLRAYLGIAGGITVPTAFGSSATIPRNKLGGLHSGVDGEEGGRPLKAGDFIPAQKAQADSNTQVVNRRFIPDYEDELDIAVIESYQSESFPDSAKYDFYNEPYKVTQQSDRMGIRLEGKAVKGELSGIISEGIAPGSIQVPANGQPIILMNDRQTLGGYPKLGCVAKRSLAQLAQARPGTVLRFYRADLDYESRKWREFLTFFGL